MPKNGTVAYITEPKKCDFPHLMRDGKVDAEYDFRTRDGRWANGCEHHWISHRMHSTLGVGKGQRLVVRVPTPRDIDPRHQPAGTVPPNEHDSSDLV